MASSTASLSFHINPSDPQAHAVPATVLDLHNVLDEMRLFKDAHEIALLPGPLPHLAERLAEHSSLYRTLHEAYGISLATAEDTVETVLADPVTALSMGLGLMFGTAGLPHILMRFFTVTNAQEARKSVFYASGIIAFFFNVIAIMGLCAIVLVGTNPDFFEGGVVGGKLIGGGNMVALHLAKAAGGNLLLGFLSAVAFATILAVVAGLALAGASAISHDLYARVIMKGQASEEKEIRVSKIATLCLGVVAVLLGMAFEKMNVAFMVALAFGVASCANFPVLLMSMYWKGLTTRGALVGGYTGLISSVLFVLFSKSVWVDVLGNPAPLFPYTQPALFAMPLAFLAIYVFSKLDNSAEAQAERAAFDDQYVRAQTGVGAASAAAH